MGEKTPKRESLYLMNSHFATGSLVLYKHRPARIRQVGDKLELETESGDTLWVRPKDMLLLHPGPMKSLGELQAQSGEVQAAWEILAGSQTTLAELAELVYERYTPATAWASWQLVADGLYFRGAPDCVIACSAKEVAQAQAARQAAAAEAQVWQSFLEHARAGQLAAGEERLLRDVEELALGHSAKSRVMRALNRDETPENAHALLLELGYWDESINPYPRRFDLVSAPPAVAVPDLPSEERVDLTHLPAFAIDDEGTETPDDAVSLQDGYLWVHVADVASLINPGTELDLEARARASSLYMPEEIVPMLPRGAVERLGLGLQEISPALSFRLEVGPTGQIGGLQVVPSWVRVTRLTYEQVEAQLEQEPFKSLYAQGQAHLAQRRANGAIGIELPEVKVRVKDGQVILQLVQPLKSRSLVEEAMIMTGEAAARLAGQQNIPLPFATQEPPNERIDLGVDKLSDMYALRRALKRSQYRNVPAPHAGLGLVAYVQVTSPLRRYLDLVAHQQLRAHLRGSGLLDMPQILERIGAAESVLGSVRQVEVLSSRHWTLVYLLRHPHWRGQGILVDKRGQTGKVLIPELGLDVPVHLPADLPLDSGLPLALRGVNLAQLEAHFRIERIGQ